MRALTIPVLISSRLLAYLDAPVERMAFLLAAPQGDSDVWTVCDELYLTDDVDYAYQDLRGMELADHVRSRVLVWSTRPDVALVEVHSHGRLSHKTSFSPTDLDGFKEVVSPMLWRLQGRPYVALVLGGDDLDALCWPHRGLPPSTPATVVLGDRTFIPTGIAREFLTREVLS